MSHRRVIAAAYDRMVAAGSVFAKVASDEEVADPLKVLDGRGWLPASVAGLDVLCLAAGGGWQSILYAAAGANVKVVDLSPAMLRLDEREACRRGLPVSLVEGSMDDLTRFEAARFDVEDVLGVGIERRQRADGAQEHPHRVRVVAEPLHENIKKFLEGFRYRNFLMFSWSIVCIVMSTLH